MIGFILGVVVGAVAVILLSKNNKKTIATARELLMKAGDNVSEEVAEARRKLGG